VLLQVLEHVIAEGGERRERKLLLRRDLGRAVLLATATRCRVEAALTLCTYWCRLERLVLLELDLSLEIVIADSSLTLSLEIAMASCTFTSSHCCSFLIDWRCLCCGNGSLLRCCGNGSLLGIMRPAVAGFAVCWVIRETGTGIRDGRSRERVLPRLVRSRLRIVRADLRGIQIEPGGEEPSGGERWRRWWGEDSRLRFFLAWAGVSAGMLEIATTSFGSFFLDGHR
jgi:hypothetical protein